MVVRSFCFLISMWCVVVGKVAVQMVNRAAIRAFDTAVALNRQEHARMAVPRFGMGVFAVAVERQIVGGQDNGIGMRSSHGRILCFRVVGEVFIVRKKQAFDKMTYRWDNHADFRLNLNAAV